MQNKFNEKVSLFKNTFDRRPTTLRLGVILDKIRNCPRLKHACATLRTLNSKDERRLFKQIKLPGITASGVFPDGRSQSNSILPSGLIQVDFDDKSFPTLMILSDIVKLLKSDPYTYVGFISPSGTGYKLLVRITSNPANHLSHFRALEEYYRNKYGLVIDPNCKDLGRLCFLSYDPFIFINSEARVFQSKNERPDSPGTGNGNFNSDLETQVESVVRQIERIKIDITDDYLNEWLKLGFALADGLGENGRSFFHRISLLSPKYDPVTADHQYNECLKARKTGITIRSFFGLAKSYGINIYPNHLKNIAGHGE